MAIAINGSGTVTGISVGGLPDGIVDTGTLATNSVDSAQLVSGSVDDAHMAAMAASKLTGALPAISGASLTNLDARDLENALPAISGASLTGLPAQAEADYFSFDMSSATGTTVHTISGSFTPRLAWMTYNPNGSVVGLVTGWLNVDGGAHGSQNANATAGKYYQGNGYFQCAQSGGKQLIDITASASGQYTVTNTKSSSPTGTGEFSLILFGN